MPTIQHNHPFDPTYGYSLEQLLALQPPEEPEGFEAFWRATFDESMRTPLNLTLAEEQSTQAGFRRTLVGFDSLGGIRINAILTAPTDRKPVRFAVVGHGYGSQIETCAWNDPNAAMLFIACRGLSLSRTDKLPDLPWHVIHGIDAKETYMHRGCVADTWAGVTALEEIYPDARGKTIYTGGSFGGGIGAMAIPWDDRIQAGKIGVPSFGNHPVRLQCQCVGSGEAVRIKYKHEPSIYEKTLRYHDSAVHAKRIRVPMFVACALFDPAVPPPGQFTVYNAIPGDKELFIHQTGHHEWEGTAADNARDNEAWRAFCAKRGIA